MGMIVSSIRAKDRSKVIVEIVLDHEEVIQLKGEIDDIHVFSERVSEICTHISGRGKNEATKYFLIPRKLRKDIAISEPVSCQRIDSKDKAIFVYVVSKKNIQRNK